jgi:hypothetical protein
MTKREIGLWDPSGSSGSIFYDVFIDLLVSYPATSLHKEARGCLLLLWLHLHTLFASTSDI